MRGLFSDAQASHSRKMQILHLYLVLWLIWLGAGKRSKKKFQNYSFDYRFIHHWLYSIDVSNHTTARS